ncbi:MAG: family 10 glycosylhydrolase [Desertifilum sp. SIO1I2]|nr:family 10 glycosylhydrolase [Desertifilum sp. SIO1I2]
MAIALLVHAPRAVVAQSPSTPVTELRGVWMTNIDSDVLFSASRLSDALQRLKQLNFNTVYPTVWNWGYTLYPSTVAQREIGRSLDPTPGLQNRDMLKEVVEQGHRLQMSVIPWFEFGFMAPAGSDLAKRHPEWITQRRDGSQIVREGKHPRVWLNPFHPEVQQFLVDLIGEVVTNYDIDGIQLDDHFGLPAELGYDPYTVKLYQLEHRGRRPPDNPQDAEWVRWRADKITQVMAKVFAEVKARKPNVLVSLSPNPQEFAYTTYLQDWFGWERRGYVEELVLQVYRNDLARFVEELQQPEVKQALSHIPVAVGVLSGLKGRSVPMQQIQQQVQEIRKQGFAGVSFFFYETLWNLSDERASDRTSAFSRLFPRTATRPSLLQCWSGSR